MSLKTAYCRTNFPTHTQCLFCVDSFDLRPATTTYLLRTTRYMSTSSHCPATVAFFLRHASATDKQCACHCLTCPLGPGRQKRGHSDRCDSLERLILGALYLALPVSSDFMMPIRANSEESERKNNKVTTTRSERSAPFCSFSLLLLLLNIRRHHRVVSLGRPGMCGWTDGQVRL